MSEEDQKQEARNTFDVLLEEGSMVTSFGRFVYDSWKNTILEMCGTQLPKNAETLLKFVYIYGESSNLLTADEHRSLASLSRVALERFQAAIAPNHTGESARSSLATNCLLKPLEEESAAPTAAPFPENAVPVQAVDEDDFEDEQEEEE